MSTKSSLAYGPNFHFYNDYADDGEAFYLEITGCTACGTQQTLRIPPEIWETIRTSTGVDLSFANLSDTELQVLVEQEVDKRIQEYVNEPRADMKHMLEFFGAGVFGLVTLPRENQIGNGLEMYKASREKQKVIVAKMATHNKAVR